MNNIYALLDESDNEEDRKVPQKKTPAGSNKKETAAKKEAPKKDNAKNDKKSKGENSAPANNSKSHANSSKGPAAVDPDSDAGKDNNRGGRPRGKEGQRRGEHKGGHGGDNRGDRRPKREFERRSGTGRGREVAKGGRGAYGAGNPAQDAQEAEKDPSAAEPPVEGAEDNAEETAEPEVEEEPEEPTYTLDEYMERRNEARVKAAALVGNVKERKVTKDSSEFAGLKSVETVDGEGLEYLPGKVSKAEAGRKDQRSTGKNALLDVGFKFESQQSDGYRKDRPFRGGGRGDRRDGGRGGRSDGRGRYGDRRGGGKGGAPTTVFNAMDFPAL